MKRKFKTLLIALMSLCMAGSMFFAACRTDDPNPGPGTETENPSGGDDDKKDPGKNPGQTENPPVVTPPEPEAGTSANPIKVYDEDVFSVKLNAGQTLYYQLVLKIEASDVVSYSVTSDNAKAVFTCGELSGNEITFPGSGSNFRFTVSTSDGSAAEFDCAVEMHAPLGSEYNPDVAVIYDGTEGTRYNEFTLDSQSATVNFTAVAETEGFYVVTSEGGIELAGGLGMTPEGEFRVVFYAKAGQSMHIGFKLPETDDASLSAGGSFRFTIQKETNCGAGTKADPYNVKAGTVYRFLITEDDEPIFVTCKNASGEIVNSRFASMNGSATFTPDGDIEVGATCNFPSGKNESIGVLCSTGSPSFIVTLR